MPKLIVKQNAAAKSRRNNLAKWLSVGGLLTLLITVATAAAYFTKKPMPVSDLEPLSFESAAIDPVGYQSLHAVLGDLMAEYAGLAERGVDDYRKNLMLSGKAESILSHLQKMTEAADQLGLDQKEYSEVNDRHQFYNDFWQAKLHFRQLRISRFESTATDSPDKKALLNEEAALSDNQEGDATQEQPEKRKFQFAKPPEGMELPAGFCDLSQGGSCKPEGAEPAVATIDEQPPKKPKFQFAKPPEGMELPAGFCDLSQGGSCKPEGAEPAVAAIDEQPPKKRKFQFAKPPEGMELPAGFCDLSQDGSCKPEGEESAGATDEQPSKKRKFQFAKPPEGMELPAGFCDLSQGGSCKPEAGKAAGAIDEQPPKKRKFQFAKPPEGMALPAGFCDLSQGGSCKPEDGGTSAKVIQNIGDLPLPDEVQDESVVAGTSAIEAPKKRKFQFAKPPEGMELPAGFCDLSNPGSCKPEGDLLSDADQPALDAVVEPDNAENKNQL